MQTMGNNPVMNMQMGGQAMGGIQMSPQMAAQQVSSYKCHTKHVIIFRVVGGAISPRAAIPTVHAEFA